MCLKKLSIILLLVLSVSLPALYSQGVQFISIPKTELMGIDKLLQKQMTLLENSKKQLTDLQSQLTESLNLKTQIATELHVLKSYQFLLETQFQVQKQSILNLEKDLKAISTQNKLLKINMWIWIPIVAVICIVLGVVGCYFAIEGLSQIGVIKL